jgi:hypothetical protein
VLNGRLWVEVGDEAISEHELGDDGPKFVTLPEHRDAFREMGTRRKTTRKAFVTMGPAAERFADGLDRLQGGASTYHMTQILKLGSRIGQRRVLDALRYATRYDAFNHTAVGRIARVRRLSATTGAIEAAAAEPPHGDAPVDSGSEADDEPSCDDARQRSLNSYGALVREKARTFIDQEDDDGQ